MMNIVETILDAYPTLNGDVFHPITGSILLKDDGDGIVYIAEWNLDKPIPEGLKVGKD